MSYKFTGSKYDRNRDVKDIAKLVRGDIRAAIKAGELPEGLKTSVRISRYAGGQSLNVTVAAAPGSAIINPARVKWDIDNPHTYPGDAPHRYAKDGQDALEAIERILSSYNYDDSDSQTDYFNVNFYGHASFDYRLERAQTEVIKEHYGETGEEFPDLSQAAFARAEADVENAEAAKTIIIDTSTIPSIPLFNLPEPPTC